MNFCSECGSAVVLRVPTGDHLPRHVCPDCGTIHYQNPKMVVGSIPEWEDVTAEYVDLKSRLKTYEAAEKELTELMEIAQNSDEVVNIFNQLMYYREQIEIIKGQIKYYEEAAALSAISVRLVAEETIKPVTIGKWEPKGVALEAIQDLLDFWKGFVNFMIRFILLILPVLVTIAIPFYLFFLVLRWFFRKLRGTKKKVEPQQTEEKK